MQAQTRIAIQGIETSFHEVAAHKFFGKDVVSVDCMSFIELCEKLKNDEADYAVMALENTVAGSLMQNYGLLQEYNFNIIGEVYLRIEMMLMALPKTLLQDVHTIQSHPIALRQCHLYLNSLTHCKLVEKEDTAAAAKEISENNLVGVAAVANRAAAELFGMDILVENIESNRNNFTRFVILSKNKVVHPSNNKASLFFNLGHAPGSLAKVLQIFAEFNINLTKIQSVPIVGIPYKYNFHVDLIWEEYKNFTEALELVKNYTVNLSILGEYKKGEFNFELAKNL
jgi:prephenate dehydratase